MIKLKRFFEDPIGAYDAYSREYLQQNQKLLNDNVNLKKQVKALEVRNKKLKSDLSKLKNLDRDWNKVVRTLYWYFTGVKMQKGSEYDFVSRVREDSLTSDSKDN